MEESEKTGAKEARFPGREAFEAWAPALNSAARESLVRRMAAAMEEEDLGVVERLARKWPSAMFKGDSSERPFARLTEKAGSFAYDAGLAWAKGSGVGAKDAESALMAQMRSLLESGHAMRMGGLAFSCAVVESGVLGPGFAEWLRETGARSHWTRMEFGSQELGIWGDGWARDAAEQSDSGAGWASVALSQALRCYMFQSEAEGVGMLGFIASKGMAPAPGWLSRAWRDLGSHIEGSARRKMSAVSRAEMSLNRFEELGRESERSETARCQAMVGDFLGLCWPSARVCAVAAGAPGWLAALDEAAQIDGHAGEGKRSAPTRRM